MSNRRKTRGPAAAPDYVRRAAAAAECPDCRSEVTASCGTTGTWHLSIAHDDECPQLAWRERNGLTSQMALASVDGKPLAPEAIETVLEAAAQLPGAKGFLVTIPDRDAAPGWAAPGWRVRDAVDRLQQGEMP